MGGGWRHLHGNFLQLGYSIEWHDFTPDKDLDWGRSFHPGSVEICLNLAGRAVVRSGRDSLALDPLTAGFYLQSDPQLNAVRCAGERHQFITIEMSRDFVSRHVASGETGLHPQLEQFVRRARSRAAVSEPVRLASEHRAMVMSFRQPPVFAGAQRLWYHGKALEAAAALFYKPPPAQELFCERVKNLNHERVQKVIAILKEDIAEPPALEEIGRRVGCSHFYLSRIFSQEMGRSMTNYLRDLRMERAAELLREGKMKVTQVAMEVGYSSPSHFSTAFHEVFGCCPGLYPLRTRSQQVAGS